VSSAVSPTARALPGRIVRLSTPLVLTFTLVVVFVVLAYVAGVQSSVVIPALVNVMLVLSIYVFSGNSGIFSFGHVGFMAIGAYTAAIVVIPPATKNLLYEMPGWLTRIQLPSLVATLIAALVTGVFAALFGLPIMRLAGIAASIATFALLVITHTVSQNLQSVTNGQSGITAVPVTVTQTTLLVAIALTLVVVFLFQNSGRGLQLRASREDEVAASGAGIRIRRERRIAWVLSGVIAGAAGALYAQFLGTFAPDSFYLDQTFVVVAMLVIGGTRSMAGAVIGALALASVSEILRQASSGVTVLGYEIPNFAEVTPVLVALFMLLVLILRPTGITGGQELSLRLPAARPSAES